MECCFFFVGLKGEQNVAIYARWVANIPGIIYSSTHIPFGVVVIGQREPFLRIWWFYIPSASPTFCFDHLTRLLGSFYLYNLKVKVQQKWRLWKCFYGKNIHADFFFVNNWVTFQLILYSWMFLVGVDIFPMGWEVGAFSENSCHFKASWILKESDSYGSHGSRRHGGVWRVGNLRLGSGSGPAGRASK